MRSPVRPVSSRGQGLSTVPELERSANRNSINFSYPMNSRPNSPSPPPSSPIPREVSTSLAQQLSEPPGSEAGNRLVKAGGPTDKRTTGTAGAGQPRTAVAAAQAAIVPVPTSTQDQMPSPPRPVMVKRPSTVPEDYQGEESAEANIDARNRMDLTRARNLSPSTEQNRSLTIRATVTPEPQIIKSPPTPERSNPPLLDQTVVSPASNRSVESERELAKLSRVRQPSSSPGRSARFSTQLSVIGTGEQLHHPPPRSVSPVKSAMKHSSQGSLSPDRIPGRPGPASSDMSDGTSVGSDDGLRIGGFKRKPVKVSFDDEAEVMGVAASPPTSPEDMLPESPPGRSKSKSTWFGVGKKKPTALDNVVGSDGFDEVLKPRPALPSFGSIRGMKDDELPEPARDEPSDNESTASSGSNAVVPGWAFANDHAIGGALASAQPEKGQGLAEKIDHPPLPLPVKTEDQTAADPAKEFVPEIRPAWVDGMQAADFTPKSKEVAASPALAPVTAESSSAAPGIAGESSTPDVGKGRSSLEGYNVPGGFPRTSLEFDPKTSSATTTPVTTVTPKKKGKRKSHDRSGSGSSSSVMIDENGMPVAISRGTDDESGDSVYSDAAEEVEGYGFGSINAIVDEQTNIAGAEATTTTNSLSNAGELATVPEESQQMIGRAVSPPLTSTVPYVPDSPDTVDEPLPFSSPYPPFPIKRKPVKAKPASGSGSGGVSRSQTTTGKKNWRQVSVGGAGGVSFSQEATNGAPLDAALMRQRTGQEKKRPVSMGPVVSNGKVGGTEDAHRPTASDSSANFRRADVPGSPHRRDGQNHTMRRTMRSGSQEPRVQFTSDRPTSPEGRRPKSSESGSGMMRTTLRNGNSKGVRPSFFSTGKSPSKSPSRKKITRGPGNLFSSSRFEDSDDDELNEGRMRNFRSRFADSSDEEDAGPDTLRPVRGIPRRQGMQDGESTELEDSSDEEKQQQRTAVPGGGSATSPWKQSASNNNNNNSGPTHPSGLAAVARSRGVSREELEDFLHQPSRKPGIFSRFSLRKPRNNPEPKLRKASTGVGGGGGGGAAAATRPEPVPEDPVQHTRGGSVTTTVRANQPLEETTTEAKTARRGSRIWAGDGWPLRSNNSERDGQTEDAAGPVSSNHDASGTAAAGLEAKERPKSPGQRRSGEGSHFPKRGATMARDVVIAGSGRRKRFPRLRRAFGLS